MSDAKTPDELLRFLTGIEKKRGHDVELVVKVTTASGKVRRRNGRFLGVRNNTEVGIHHAARGKDTWYLLSDVLDIWKKADD